MTIDFAYTLYMMLLDDPAIPNVQIKRFVQKWFVTIKSKPFSFAYLSAKCKAKVPAPHCWSSFVTTPTRVHQRLSQNNLRKRQISCETTAELSKWTNIVSKNYEPNRKNYAPDCARFCDGILHEKCLKIHANTENAVLFFCNGVVIDLLHFNSEKRRCQGHLKRIIVISLCWTQTQTMFGPFFFSERNFCWF